MTAVGAQDVAAGQNTDWSVGFAAQHRHSADVVVHHVVYRFAKRTVVVGNDRGATNQGTEHCFVGEGLVENVTSGEYADQMARGVDNWIALVRCVRSAGLNPGAGVGDRHPPAEGCSARRACFSNADLLQGIGVVFHGNADAAAMHFLAHD